MIEYPSYSALGGHTNVYNEVGQQNKKLLEFSTKHDCTWNHFTNKWVEENFGRECNKIDTPVGVLVTLAK